jgi:hypothetical protein
VRLRWIVLAGAILRLVAVVGITPTIYVDSGEYRGVALLGGRRRPWTVPLLHAVVGDGVARVIAHALLGVAAWAALAYAIAETLEHPRVRLGAVAAVMTMGAVAPVANYDTTITSESVAVSLAVLLFAALLRLARLPTVGRAVAVLVVAVPFAFTRNDHPYLVAVLAAITAVLAVRRRPVAWAVVAVGLIATSTWSLYAAGRNDEIARFNLALVVANRVLPDVDATEFFVDRGMPLPTIDVGDDTVLTLADDDDWNEWAGEEGRRTYVRWLVSNPRHLVLSPWPDLLGLRSTTLEGDRLPTVMLAPNDRYGRVHQVVPEPIEALLWGGTGAAPVLLAAVGLGVAAARRRLPPGDAMRAVGVGALVIAIGHVVVVWHSSPLELGRLAMVAATTMHVALLLLVATTVDGWVRSLRRSPAATRG